jgi:hypothetical protein
MTLQHSGGAIVMRPGIRESYEDGADTKSGAAGNTRLE